MIAVNPFVFISLIHLYSNTEYITIEVFYKKKKKNKKTIIRFLFLLRLTMPIIPYTVWVNKDVKNKKTIKYLKIAITLGKH